MDQIIVNIGSSSKKYALYRNHEKVCTWGFEKIGAGYKLVLKNTERTEESLMEEQFVRAVERVLNDCARFGVTVSDIIVRTVAPGDYFAKHRIVNDTFMQHFAEREYLAPLHIAPTRKELEIIRSVAPGVRIISASDSAFHRTKPKVAKEYALPKALVAEYGFERFGYHGHSVASIVSILRRECGESFPKKAIVMHLGSGASITAVSDGLSIDTTMGFSPLEGLPMNTRSGTIDASVIFALLSSGKTREDIEMMLNKQSGLLGVSGASSDMRDVLRLSAEGDTDAQLALDLFVYHVVKTVGAYVAVLGGLDALVFTAAIGEGAPVVRRMIVEKLSSAFRLALHEEKNSLLLGNGGEPVFLDIATEDSAARLYVIQTNEAESILAASKEAERG